MGAFVGVDGFQVHHVADDVEFVGNAVAAVHVAGRAGNLQRLAAVVALQEGNGLGRELARIHQAARLQAGGEAEGDFGLHVRQLFLEQLGGGERTAELLAIQPILPRRMPAEFRRAKRAPGDAIARVVEAAERPAKALDLGEHAVFGNEHVFQHHLAGETGAQRELALDLGRGEALVAALDDEAADFVLALFVRQLGPDHEHLRDGRVGDPHLRAVQHEAAIHAFRAGFHAARIRPGIGLGQAEGADPFAAGEFGQVFLAVRLGAVGVDRPHDERRLYGEGRAIGGIHPFHFPRDQAVGNIGNAGAAVALEGGAEQTEFACLGHHLGEKLLVPVAFQHPGHELFLAVGPCGIPNKALFFRQAFLQQQRIFPPELGPSDFLRPGSCLRFRLDARLAHGSLSFPLVLPRWARRFSELEHSIKPCQRPQAKRRRRGPFHSQNDDGSMPTEGAGRIAGVSPAPAAASAEPPARRWPPSPHRRQRRRRQTSRPASAPHPVRHRPQSVRSA